MMRARAGGLCLLLAGSAWLATPAAAQVSVEASASNLRFVLTDLAPDDGEAPWFRFIGADMEPLTQSIFLMPEPGAELRVTDFAERRGLFEFSSNTQVSLGLDVDIAMLAQPFPGAQQSGTASIAFVAIAEWGHPRDRQWMRDSDDVYGDVGQYFGAFRPSYERSGTLWLEFVNGSDYAASGDYFYQIESIAQAVTSPVPEAPAPLMLLLGASLLGLWRRPSPGQRQGAECAARESGGASSRSCRP